MKKLQSCSLVFILMLASGAHGFAEDLRTWYSADGADSVEATFVGYDSKSKTVKLSTANGESVNIALILLSQPDQRYVKRVGRRSLNKKQGSVTKNLGEQPSSNTDSFARQNRNGKQGQLFGINWVVDIENALELARGRDTPTDDRPVMWLRVLGDLNGLM